MKEMGTVPFFVRGYYRRRDVWAPHWFCEEADFQGLFPETRRQRS